MQFPINKYDGNVFNIFGSFAITNQPASTFFNDFNRHSSRSFTCVAALGKGKIRNYPRVEMLNSFFN